MQRIRIWMKCPPVNERRPHDERVKMDSVCSKLESILFTAGEPVAFSVLAEGFGIPETEVRRLLDRLEQHYEQGNSGLRVFLTEEGVQLVTNPENAEAVSTVLSPVQRKNVSNSLLETLAIIAYKQPVTRGDIEEVRGVRCEYAVDQLLKLGLIVRAGRKDVPGRPVLFATTDTFLRQFNLHSLEELPGKEPGELFGTV